MKKITKPLQGDDDAYFWMYIDKAKGNNLLKSLKKNKKSFLKLIKNIPEDMGNYAYDEGKWSIKTVICHLIDAERVFAYRALCISRGDQSKFPGYDENEYADEAKVDHLTIKQLAKEFEQVRNSTISLFQHMDPARLVTQGNTSGLDVTPQIIGWKMVGHVAHHAEVLEERYL